MFDREEIENIILGMAEIVMENRNLRYEVKRLEGIVERYDEDLRNRIRDSQNADKELLKIILERALMGDDAE